MPEILPYCQSGTSPKSLKTTRLLYVATSIDYYNTRMNTNQAQKLLLGTVVAAVAGFIGYYTLKRCFPTPPIIDNPRNKKKRIVILYGTTTGTSKSFAHQIAQQLGSLFQSVIVKDLKDYDYEAYLHKEKYLLVLISTWSEGTPPVSCQPFFNGIQDILHDFRYSKDHLSKLKFSILGLGAKVYKEHFCTPVSHHYTTYPCHLHI